MLWKLLSRRMPALFTTMSMRPKLSSAVCTMAAPPSGVATELVSSTASPPAASISSTTCWPGPASPPVPSTAPPTSLTTTMRAPAGEQQRVLPSQATARAGDDRHLAVETEIRHRRSTPSPLLDRPHRSGVGARASRPRACKTRRRASGAGVGGRRRGGRRRRRDRARARHRSGARARAFVRHLRVRPAPRGVEPAGDPRPRVRGCARRRHTGRGATQRMVRYLRSVPGRRDQPVPDRCRPAARRVARRRPG